MLSLNFIFAMIFMMMTGYFDGQAFSAVPHIWQTHGSTQISEIVKSLIYFNLAVITFIISNYFLHQQGIENAVVVTLIWFVVTIIGVTILSGSFFSLPFADKVISIVAVVLVGLLYYRGVAE